ncbi:MAG TPA: hypothetical protein VLE73_06580 [Candidatus Saccharimonadales bacterium]|nr:hypothetical protein [Candidatus Saccharimonadales bacterium]
MNTLEFPEPPVGVEVFKTEFLSNVQQDIDCMVGTPTRLLTSLIVGSLEPAQEAHIYDITTQVARLTASNGGSSKKSGLHISGGVAAHIKGELAPRIVTLGERLDNGRILSSVRRTEKARDNVALVGALAATQLIYGMPIGTTLSNSFKSGEQHIYPYAPTQRLRLAQLIEAQGGATPNDIVRVYQCSFKKAQSIVTRMATDNIIAPQYRNRAPRVLSNAVQAPMVQLLRAIASLQDPEHGKEYGEALTRVARKLLQPEHRLGLVRPLIEGWNRQLPLCVSTGNLLKKTG